MKRRRMACCIRMVNGACSRPARWSGDGEGARRGCARVRASQPSASPRISRGCVHRCPGTPFRPTTTTSPSCASRCTIGARERWGGAVTPRQAAQIEHELAVINRLGFAGFFLVMWDAVRFAAGAGILCQGRGSAANSVIAFCLGITAVDPVEHGLLFERFLSRGARGREGRGARHRRGLRARPARGGARLHVRELRAREGSHRLHRADLPRAQRRAGRDAGVRVSRRNSPSPSRNACTTPSPQRRRRPSATDWAPSRGWT